MSVPRETIAAVATAQGRGGVGIVRISGPLASVAAKAFSGRELKPRFAHYGPFFSENDEVLDQGIALYFPGPNSFTGEDVLELQGHGGLYLEDCNEAVPSPEGERRFGYVPHIRDREAAARLWSVSEALLVQAGL